MLLETNAATFVDLNQLAVPKKKRFTYKSGSFAEKAKRCKSAPCGKGYLRPSCDSVETVQSVKTEDETKKKGERKQKKDKRR